MHDYSNYKGNNMLVLKRSEDDKYPFQFGAAKAKLIMDNLDAVKEFAETYAPKTKKAPVIKNEDSLPDEE